MRALALVFLIACGGGSGEVEGDPLIQTTLTAEFNNKAWTPIYGFGRTKNTTFELFVGAEKISCADDFKGTPREGHFAATGVPAPIAVGTFASSTLNLVEVADGNVDMQISIGSVQITAVNAELDVSAVFAFDLTVSGARYALNGAVTMLRCP